MIESTSIQSSSPIPTPLSVGAFQIALSGWGICTSIRLYHITYIILGFRFHTSKYLSTIQTGLWVLHESLGYITTTTTYGWCTIYIRWSCKLIIQTIILSIHRRHIIPSWSNKIIRIKFYIDVHIFKRRNRNFFRSKAWSEREINEWYGFPSNCVPRRVWFNELIVENVWWKKRV